MDRKFNLDIELKKLYIHLEGKPQISTIDLALIFNICNNYIKNKLGVDILTIYDKINDNPEDITRYLMFCLYSEPKILNIINKYGISDILSQTMHSMGNKGIIEITDTIIQNSNKRPHQMPIPSDENQIRRIFKALRKNYYLYEQLYKDKVWLINSTNNNGDTIGQARIKISPYMFFHLMGFDYKNILNPNKKDRDGTSHERFAREFASIFPDSNMAFGLLQQFGGAQVNQYKLIELLLENEERFLEAALSGNLSNTVNIDKLEMKSYSFERMGAIQTASGMVFFDKQKAISLGYGSSLQHINTDIILLNDFIRKYDLQKTFGLDFVFSPFDKIKNSQISDQQSIFLTRQAGGGLNSGILDDQMASISSSAVGYRENDFDYSITQEGEHGGIIVEPYADPILGTEFSEEERKRVAQTIIEGIPGIDQTYLNELLNGKKRKK